MPPRNRNHVPPTTGVTLSLPGLRATLTSPGGNTGESEPRFGPHPIARPGKTRAECQATEDGHEPECR